MRSASIGRFVKEKRKKAANQPPGILKEQYLQIFPPTHPTIRTLDTEQLDAKDAQQTVIKEVARRRRPTMEEIRRLEKELVEANERNARNNLRDGSGESGHSGEADGENFSEGEQFTTTGVGYRRGRAIRLGRRGGARICKGDTLAHSEPP